MAWEIAWGILYTVGILYLGFMAFWLIIIAIGYPIAWVSHLIKSNPDHE